MNLTQILTPGAGVRLESMHHDLNMGVQNIGVLQHNLTVLCTIVVTLEQKIYYLSQHDTAQSIKEITTIDPRNDFDVKLLTLSAELDRVQQLMEGGGFNIVVGHFKSLTDVTV